MYQIAHPYFKIQIQIPPFISVLATVEDTCSLPLDDIYNKCACISKDISRRP